MYYFKFVKTVPYESEGGETGGTKEQYYHYSAKFYTNDEFGKFTLYGFNGSEPVSFADGGDYVTIYVNKKNYERVYIMNSEGKTIDRFTA